MDKMNKHVKEYLLGFGLSMGFYIVAVFVSITLLKRYPDLPFKTLVAVLPVIPILFALRAFLRYLNNIDELQQRIQMNSIAFAAGATGIGTLTYGFMENAGFPQLSWLWVLPIMMVIWGIATAVASRRYS
ncbi:MAG: hypothetical protein KDE46_04345 [Caldilineaceae bacterium]|nr:hypothetical protein [Caldilineaceae bacterium]